jgi:hypothetical protein
MLHAADKRQQYTTGSEQMLSWHLVVFFASPSSSKE